MLAERTYESMAQTVYETDKDKKHHAKNSELVKTNKNAIELAYATNAEYGHCKLDVSYSKKSLLVKMNK
jgi:hypothetical protein